MGFDVHTPSLGRYIPGLLHMTIGRAHRGTLASQPNQRRPSGPTARASSSR